MKRHNFLAAAAVAALLSLQGAASAGVVNLASTMNPAGYISESTVTGSFARINQGNGSLGSVGANTGDADGLYDINKLNDPSAGSPFGTPLDIFPREANFVVGSLTYNELAITGSGVESTPITAIDLSGFWKADPNRTSSTPGATPSVLSDISDRALGLWFFDSPGAILFGALDAADTVTFTNGQLTSINLQIPTSFTIDLAGLVYTGSFSITGNQISYQINDTQNSPFGPATVVVNLTGTVNSVVPEPATCLMAVPAIVAACSLRRRR